MGAVFGLGFPPFWGGPFRMLDLLGADRFVRGMTELAALYGSHFQPCPLLTDHARHPEKKFHV